MVKYYSTSRPVSIGTYPQPEGNKVLNIENFDRRTYCPEIGRDAWGFIEYQKPLAETDAANYELVKEVTMFNWKVEEMALMNMKSEDLFQYVETTSKEDKLAFVDAMNNDAASYILTLAEKFQAEKSDLALDKRGRVKTVSLKAWLKRNVSPDAPVRIKTDGGGEYVGQFQILGCERYIYNVNSRGWKDAYRDLVDECFYRQLKKCIQLEKNYFFSTDEYTAKKQELREKMRKVDTTFGVYILDYSNGTMEIADECGEKGRPITISEIDKLLENYEKVLRYVADLSEMTHIVY